MTDFQKNEAGILVPSSKIAVKGIYQGEIIRGGYYDDNGVWRRGTNVVDRFEDENLVVNEGLNSILNIMFYGTTQITSWYLGVFKANATPLSSWTASNVASNSTEATEYASGTRPAYTPATASSQSITNSASRASFVFNASITVYGAFLISNSTKSGTSGTLFSAASFSSSKSVVSSDELLLTYTFTASSV